MRPITFIAIAVVFVVPACSDSKTTKSDSPITTTKPKTPPETENRYPPCHPGCFPAGTVIDTPSGPRNIEAIQTGDIVTIVGTDGKAVRGTVGSIYRTTNRLLEVQTESGTLRTTDTQPLCLAAGGFRTASELVAGDIIWGWSDGQRRAVRVEGVKKTGQDAPVFNLVVGESAVFVAGGFLARGKPPASEPSDEKN